MVSANNAINDTVGASISGVTNTLTVTNASNTASSAARETIVVGGGTAGDPTINWNVSGVTNWEMGIDNSDSDKLKMSLGTALGTNDVWRMTTSGQRTLPLQPSFQATVSANVNNVTGDGTHYTIIYDTEVFDIGSNYNNATGTFTVPIDGKYFFSASGGLALIPAGSVNGILVFSVNGTTDYQMSVVAGLQNIRPTWTATQSIVLSLTAGDTVNVYISAQGTAKVLQLYANPFGGRGVNCHFSGFLVC